MPWLSRGPKKPHECARPELYRLGDPGQPGSRRARPGAEWACRRCGKVWEVVERVVVPPGYCGDHSRLTATRIAWRLNANKEYR